MPPREGIVINVAEMRLYYYPKGKNVVEVLPIGIGQLGTDTPGKLGDHGAAQEGQPDLDADCQGAC